MKLLDKIKKAGYACRTSAPIWAIAKLTASALEKLAVGSALVGIFQGRNEGIALALGCFIISAIIVFWDERRK